MLLPRALVLSMVEILFLCGNKKRVAVATLSVFTHHPDEEPAAEQKNEVRKKESSTGRATLSEALSLTVVLCSLWMAAPAGGFESPGRPLNRVSL